jgi:hypothetical protein
MSIDFIKLAPNSFKTIFLRREDRLILRTEAGRRIVVQRIIPEEWKAYRFYEYEQALNDNKRNIQLVDRVYLSQIEKELEDKLR